MAETENGKKQVYKKENYVLTIFKRMFKNRVSLIGFIILAIIILLAIFAPLIAPYDPVYMDYSAVNATASGAHIMGCDNLGRDIFSRILYGARYSLGLGFIVAIIGMIIGIFFGCIIGYAGGYVDVVAMRICDIISAVPGTLLCILISTVLGTGFFNTILAMTIGGIPGSIRGSRAMALKEREQDYLEAASAMNCSTMTIIFKHMMPNIVSPTIVSTTMMIGNTIMQASGLSFIGLGIQQPTPEWGAMLSAATSYIFTYPHEILWPGIAIIVTVLATNMIGDGLRDAMDPKLND